MAVISLSVDTKRQTFCQLVAVISLSVDTRQTLCQLMAVISLSVDTRQTLCQLVAVISLSVDITRQTLCQLVAANITVGTTQTLSTGSCEHHCLLAQQDKRSVVLWL